MSASASPSTSASANGSGGCTSSAVTSPRSEDREPVVVIVKAPNQAVPDHIVTCSDLLTVAALKAHLADHYPSHPKYEEQKLIYSGQLLADTIILKDILRHYEGQKTHTFHLVCAIPNIKYKPAVSPSSSQETPNPAPAGDSGVRRRNVENDQSANSTPRMNIPAQTGTQGYQFPQPYYWDNNHINMWSNLTYQWANQGNYQPNSGMGMMMPANVDPSALGAQLAWIQQLQTQYMQFYSQLLQSSGATIGPLPTNPIHIETSPPVIQEQPNANAVDVANNQINNVNNNNQNFQNDLDNWDWLDWFHMMSRLMLMFAVVYFYSSPPRFLLVVSAGYMVYLYRIGYFQGLFNNNENAADNANNNQINNQPDQETEQEENGPENPTDTAVREENVPQNNTPEQPSFLSLSWTIISSFITSILPENPNAI